MKVSFEGLVDRDGNLWMKPGIGYSRNCYIFV